MLEIEINDGRNGDYLFHPTGERVRGRFEVTKVNATELGTLPRDLPNGVPGMLIRFDPATNTGSVVDPLHDPAHAATKAAIERRIAGQSAFGGSVDFGQPVKEYPNADRATWTGWMRRCVLAGCGRVTKGKLPDADPDGMRKSFYHQERTDPKDDLIRQAFALCAAFLPADKKKEMAALLGEAK